MEAEDFIRAMEEQIPIEFCVMDRWIPGTIVGIDLIDNLVKVKHENSSHWMKPYFQLNKNFEKIKKIRIP